MRRIAARGQVLNLDGIRVAGLGGNFLGRIWSPPAEPIFRNKTAAMKRGPHQRRDGQQASPKLQAAIYLEDVDLLARQRADILVTHEAPSCHHHGWPALDQLARDMEVVRTFHGHTHDDLREVYAGQREQLGFDARAVNFCCIKNVLGEQAVRAGSAFRNPSRRYQMTMPDERARALRFAGEVLRDLMTNPDVPVSVKQEARATLRHCPSTRDLKDMVRDVHHLTLNQPGQSGPGTFWLAEVVKLVVA